MNLERVLVLNRYFLELFGAERFEDLRRSLRDKEEGPGPDGHSRFFHDLAGRSGIKVNPTSLEEYDRRIMDYEAALARHRRSEPFLAFKYFQYLALLYTEIFLDRLTADPGAFLAQLNDYRASKPDFADIPPFERDDLRRIAFFMATGSGKTLLLHVNVLQLLHYLESGTHPDALVRRSDGRAEFDNILLITPGEGLSDQHLLELDDSGIEASRFDRSLISPLFGPRVYVIEIHKLTEEPFGQGVSVPIVELGTRNLIIVDEGHKGTGTEARTWKTRQEALSHDGFLLEYSATFAQAIGAAPRKVQGELLATYGKAILFDYSYRYFHGDGHGKTFHVINLQKASAKKAHELMLGGLLIFYQQSWLHGNRNEGARMYNIEKPLWVLLGTSVSRKRADEKDASKTAQEERTDVGEVIAFLRRFLEDPDWAVNHIAKTITGKSGFAEKDSHIDLFDRHMRYLANDNPKDLYARICRDLFHGRGGLECMEVRRSGEIGLRVTAASGKELPYFGVINIGDVADFRKYLEAKHSIRVRDDEFSESLFSQIGQADSPMNILIGAKRFIEGWSSWRVSSMSLLRVGKGEGSQVIQLFGRGVRLKGKNKSLKRSHTLADAPDWLESLETLYITGWNADFMHTFREVLDREEVEKELPTLRLEQKDIPGWALVPQTPQNFDASLETWVLDLDGPRVVVDMVPRVASLAPEEAGAIQRLATAGDVSTILPGDPPYVGLLDLDELYSDLLEYKFVSGYDNVFVHRMTVGKILSSRCELRMLSEEAGEPPTLRRAASRALRAYLDRFIRLREREAEAARAEPRPLVPERQITYEYRIRIYAVGLGERLLGEIEALLEKVRLDKRELLKDAGVPLPRMYLDWHLFNPLLLEGGKEWQAHVNVSPRPLVISERKLVEDLRAFWRANSTKPRFREIEVCLLRNLPKVGIGLFSRSGFYPDFILWIHDRKKQTTRVVFLDPHGLHDEGVRDNDRFAAIAKLRELGAERRFIAKRISLDAFILAPAATTPDKIPGAQGSTWDDLERTYPLFRQEGAYVDKIFSGPS